MVNTKKFFEETNSATPVNIQMIRKQSNIIVDTGKILVFWIDGQINHNIPLIGSLWLSKESAFNVGDLGSIPGLGRFPGGGRGNPIQFFCLENPHGQRCLVGYSPWGRKQSDITEWLSTIQSKALILLNTVKPAGVKEGKEKSEANRGWFMRLK